MAVLTQQVAHCQALLRSLSGSNPFYTRKFEEAGTPYSVRNLVEFADSVPLTTPAELLADRRANPPWGTNLSLPVDRYRFVHVLGGGEPAAPWQLDTAESWDDFLANGAEVLRSGGVSEADRIFFSSSFEERPGCCLPVHSGRHANCVCLSGAGLDAAAQWAAILDFGTTVLCGDADSLLRLADQAAGVDLGRSRIRLIWGDGRPNRGAGIRTRLASLLVGVQFREHYALSETGPVAYECPARPGILHFLEPAFIPEVIDPLTGRPVEAGVEGELVLTTLFRPGSPLVRYRTGDMVRLSPDTACDCGRYYTALEGGILGRVGHKTGENPPTAVST
jgi:phenylacetate-CoA ligase